VRTLHVHFGLLLGELDDHRIGERGLAEAKGAEAPLHCVHADGEGDPIPERLEWDDPHL